MTIVVGAIVKPKGKRKPFFIMGSDTRGINEAKDGSLICTDNQQKIFPFNSMFLGVAGVIPNNIFKDLPRAIMNLELDFDYSCQWLIKEVKGYLDSYLSGFENINYFRIRMILGTLEGNLPKMAVFEYDTRFMTEMTCKKHEITNAGSHIEFIGDTSKTMQKQSELKKRLANAKNILETEKMIEDFMYYTASVYPDKCNTMFDFQRVEGEKP